MSAMLLNQMPYDTLVEMCRQMPTKNLIKFMSANKVLGEACAEELANRSPAFTSTELRDFEKIIKLAKSGCVKPLGLPFTGYQRIKTVEFKSGEIRDNSSLIRVLNSLFAIILRHHPELSELFGEIRNIPIGRFDGILMQPSDLTISKDGKGYAELYYLPKQTIPYYNLGIEIDVHRPPPSPMYVTVRAILYRNDAGCLAGPYLDPASLV